MNENPMVNMLKTLMDSGTISTDDIISTLSINKESENMKLPSCTYVKSQKRYVMYIPASESETGKRKGIFGKTEDETLRNYFIATKGIAVETKERKILEEKVCPRFDEFMDFVLKSYKYKVKEDTTYDRYDCTYRNHVKDTAIGKKKVNEITSADLTNFFKSKTDGKYSESTVKGLLVIVRATFLRAKEQKLIGDNIADYIEISYRNCKKPYTRSEKDVYTIDDIEALEKVIGDGWKSRRYFYSPAFLVMAYSGMRIGEILGLKWSDIDFENHIIYVNKQYVEGWKRDANGDKKGKKYYVKQPKSETSIREVVMLDKTEYWLKELKSRYEQRGCKSDLVVCNRKGKTPTKSNMYEMLDRIIKKANISYASSHKFRKMFASEALDSGISLSKVAGLLGHKNPNTTLKDYAKITSRNSDENVRAKLNLLYDKKNPLQES